MVIKEETQVESPPEQEEPTVKEQEHLPQEIIVDKGKFQLQKVWRVTLKNSSDSSCHVKSYTVNRPL